MADTAAVLVRDAGSQLQITDRRADPPPIMVSFTGTLRDTQPAAVTALTHHDLGVLEAPPGTGSTVKGQGVQPGGPA